MTTNNEDTLSMSTMMFLAFGCGVVTEFGGCLGTGLLLSVEVPS